MFTMVDDYGQNAEDNASAGNEAGVVRFWREPTM